MLFDEREEGLEFSELRFFEGMELNAVEAEDKGRDCFEELEGRCF